MGKRKRAEGTWQGEGMLGSGQTWDGGHLHSTGAPVPLLHQNANDPWCTATGAEGRRDFLKLTFLPHHFQTEHDSLFSEMSSE